VGDLRPRGVGTPVNLERFTAARADHAAAFFCLCWFVNPPILRTNPAVAAEAGNTLEQLRDGVEPITEVALARGPRCGCRRRRRQLGQARTILF
jgi:hypothetical protein